MTKGTTGAVYYATNEGSYGDASSLVFFTAAELEEWAADHKDPADFIDQHGDHLHSIVLERTGRKPGVPLSVLDEVL